jgi:hypothetical protein
VSSRPHRPVATWGADVKAKIIDFDAWAAGKSRR